MSRKRITSASSGKETEKEDGVQTAIHLRNMQNFFEKFERYECQELLSSSSYHWMLSSEDYRLPTDPPAGLISRMYPPSESHAVLLMPLENDPDFELDYREIHQIIRELVLGIFMFNQTPKISLEANFDQSTSCQLPSAYQDTRIGQAMVSVDYMMKALWHGAYFPKEKRTKFSERWRSNLDVNASGKPETKKLLLTEFKTAGILDITKDPDFSEAYDRVPDEQTADTDMADERRFFMSFADSLSMQMTLSQEKVVQHHNLFVVDADWLVTSIVRLTNQQIDHAGYERLNTRLQLHEQIIRENLVRKAEIRHQLFILKLVSFLVPFMIGLRKRMKIPDISRLLLPLTGDETKTERELPPLMLGSDFKCKNFNFGNHYFHLHGGILMDLETPLPESPDPAILDRYEELCAQSLAHLHKTVDPDLTLQEHYPVPNVDIDGKRYAVICIETETFYPQTPQKPLWIRPFTEEIARLKLKRLPMNEIHLHEQFKKFFGVKKAIKYKTPHAGLRACAQRGLVTMFHSLCRKMPAARLGKQDEQGYSYIHYAAMNNHPEIIGLLLLQSIDVNVRRGGAVSADGEGNSGLRGGADSRHSTRSYLLEICPTALHLAARCGALDSVSCLLANYASMVVCDAEGWAPIHHAAFYDHEPVIRLIVRRADNMLEFQTKNEYLSTPLLLAASSGALAAVKCLISLGADINKKDALGNGMVNLAALRFHTNVLEYLIEWNNPEVPVWKLLVEMIGDESIVRKDSAIKCLEVLSTSRSNHWKSILDAGGVAAFVQLLKVDNEEIQSVAASALCNISEHRAIQVALTKADAGPTLVQLLGSPVDDIQSRAAIILSDLACVGDNQDILAEQGVVPALINLLESELEDVLVNTVNALRVLCQHNRANQTLVAEEGGIDPLVEFLTVDSENLQAGTAAALAALTRTHRANQDAVVAEGAVKPLVHLIKGRNITVQVKAASALESLAENNPASQKAFLQLNAPDALIRLLKNINTEVREQGACSLWALAGHTKTQQRHIAERVGIQFIIQMLLEPTEKLLYVGCMMAIALGRENIANQNKLAEADAFQQLARLLRSHKTSDRVLLVVIKVIGTLCVGVAYRNNKLTQRRLAEEGTIPVLVQLLLSPPNQEIQVEIANTLGCVVLSNRDNQEKLKEVPGFQFEILLDLLRSKDEDIRLKAGMALTVFAFNNTPQQYAIREAGGIRFSVFQRFLNSTDEYYQCYAAFQIVVLARVIIDQDQVSLTARGVSTLVDMVRSDDDNVVVLASSLLSSLAHTRAGIPDAMVTLGVIDLLMERLDSDNDLVRTAVAVALGYLTFNKTAARLLLASCRNCPGLYDQMMNNIGSDPKISTEFVEAFRRAKIIGLPSQCLEINGGPPVIPPVKRGTIRPSTSFSPAEDRPVTRQRANRAKSAPAYSQGLRSQSSQSCSTRISNTSSVAKNSKPEGPKDRSASRDTYTVNGRQKSAVNSGFKSHLLAWKEDRKKPEN